MVAYFALTTCRRCHAKPISRSSGCVPGCAKDIFDTDGQPAGNYLARYLFAAAGSAVVLPAVEKIGVGWFSTVSGLFLVVVAVGVHVTTVWGKSWRDKIDRPKQEKVSARPVHDEKLPA